MEDVYDNLDNFTDESTIAELREENSGLKIRLEEYAVKLDQLQKEFDMLTSEHKKLEMNYSSLLKTAKAEIERKSLIITKLNIEKDAMVLNSIQNRNTYNSRRRYPINRPVISHEAKFGDLNQTQFSGDSSARTSLTNQSAKERREDNSYPSSITSTPRNTQTRLLDNVQSAKNSEAKENIVLKDDSKTISARISNRRKSMPVFSMEKFSSEEDELMSIRSSKERVTKEQPEKRCLDKLGPSIDKLNLEDNMIDHQKYSIENKSRHSLYDEKYISRDRHGSSKKYRRDHSPDRSRRRSHDRRHGSQERRRSIDRNIKETRGRCSGSYKREYERSRRLVSPSKDKYHDYKHRTRDSPRSSERSYPTHFDRHKSRNQDMYAIKHKMQNDYEHSSKRIRLDSYPKHEERLRIERQIGPLPLDLDDMHGMSCQSPDQTHLESQTLPCYQTKEIKLYASSKLDDPRLVSKKYILKNHDGKPELSTVESANIDMKVIDTSNWEMIKKMKMPDALLKKPENSDMQSVSLQRLTSSIPDASSQKINSSGCSSAAAIIETTCIKPNVFMQNEESTTSMPETSDQKPKSLKSTNITDTLHVQKPCLHDDLISNYPTPNAMPTDMTDILIQEPSGEMMPVLTTQKATSNDDIEKDIYMDIDTPSHPRLKISTGSGKLYNFQNDFHGPEINTNEINTSQHVTEPQNIENIFPKSSNYKIPKKIHKNIQNTKTRKYVFDDHDDNQKLNAKHINKNTDNINDSYKPINEIVDKKDTEIRRQNENTIPKLRCSGYQDYVTTKETIEGDLELSDENSDNADVQMHKQIQTSGNNNQVSEMKDEYLTCKHNLTTNQFKFEFDEISTEKVEEQNLKQKNIETTETDSRKSKTRRKSLKLKDTKEPHVNKDTSLSMDKPIKKKECTTKELFENNDISLSMDQLVTIKKKITKELSEDKELSLSMSKTVKKKDNKSKLSSKNKDAAPWIYKPIHKKETISKELTECKDTLPMHKTVKTKENKPKQLSNKKESVLADKLVKTKEIKTKESLEPKVAQLLEKSVKKKEIKKTESSENIEHPATTSENQKKKELKAKETKFNELFGDSSSLVSPEDLGLVPTVVVPPENYVELFEDAQDATDLSADIIPSAEKTEKNDIFRESAAISNYAINVKNTETAVVEPAYQNTRKPNNMVTAPAECSINQTIYQNLQPQISPKDKDIVKTVIISTGIQPQRVLGATSQCHFENDKMDADLHVMQCVKPTVLHDTALQALATSTPQKFWQQNVVQAEIDPKLNLRCSINSQKESIDQIPVIVHSDTTNNSQTNNADEPDMTIFVKRRRKVVKKKL